MEYTEEVFKRLLSSPGGNQFGQSILDAIAGGDIVVIVMRDGHTLTLSDWHMARRTLKDKFEWPSHDAAVNASRSREFI